MESKAVKGAPWFPFYPADFLGGTFAMDAAEVGAYLRLLCLQWQGGGLPNDPAKLAALSGHAFAYAIASKFDVCADGLLRNARLEECRKKAGEKSQKATASAVKRWEAQRPDDANAHANAYANAMRGQRSEVRGQNTEDKEQKPEAKGGSKGERASKPKEPLPPVEIPATLPENIDCTEIRGLLADWITSRLALKSPVTQVGMNRGVARLAKFGGRAEAIESLTTTIVNGWKGFFKPDKERDSHRAF